MDKGAINKIYCVTLPRFTNMVLPDSSYLVDNKEISEFRNIVQIQLNSVNTQISDLSSKEYGPPGFTSLILAILSLASILLINWTLILNYWISSLLVTILILIIINTVDYTRMAKSATLPKAFQNIKEFKIAYLLTLKTILKNSKPNEIAFFFVLLTGWIIMIYNYFEYNVNIDVFLFSIYTAVLFFYLIEITFDYLMYDLFVWILTEIGNPIYEGIVREGYPSIMHINFFRPWKNANKFQLIYTFVYLAINVLIILLLFSIWLNYPKELTWDYAKNVIHVAIFQFFILITLMIFISFKFAKNTYEKQKGMLNRILTSLEHSKQAIDRQLFANGKKYYKISKLCYGQKVNFAVFFTKWMIVVNGELNIKENYDWLYQFLKIPEEPISD